MPITQADIDEMNQALAAGEKSVTINGKTVIYRSVEEIVRARDELMRLLAEQRSSAVQGGRPKRVLLYHGGRGF